MPERKLMFSFGNWTDTDSEWVQADTHERHCTAAGPCDWRDQVWAYIKDGPPVAPRPGRDDHVFIYAPQCVDMRTLPPNETFRQLSIYGAWPYNQNPTWSGLIFYPFMWRVWNKLRSIVEFPFRWTTELWWRYRVRRELLEEDDT